MKIQKIFTDINGDECLYSVLMSEEELSLFSRGKETDHQKKERRKLAALGGVGSAAIGTEVGLISSKPRIKKIAEKAAGNISKMGDQNVDLVRRMINTESGGFKNKEARDFYRNVVEPRANKILEANNRGMERTVKISKKMMNKTAIKRAGIGALAGAGVGALAVNHSLKKKNKK